MQDREAVLARSRELKQEMNESRNSERSCDTKYMFATRSKITLLASFSCPSPMLFTYRRSLTTLTLQSDAAIKELQRKKEKVCLHVHTLTV